MKELSDRNGRMARRDFTYRSRTGGYVYPVAFAVLVSSSSQIREHLLVALAAALALCLLTAARLALIKKMLLRPLEIEEREVDLLKSTLVLSGLTWGLVAAWVLRYETTMTSALVLVACAAVTTGAFTTMAPAGPRLYFAYCIAINTPLVGVLISSPRQADRGAGLMVFCLCLLALWYSVQQSRDYIKKLEDEERLSLIMESAQTGVMDWYPLEGRLHVDHLFWCSLGYPPQESTPGRFIALIHPEDAPTVKQRIIEVLKEDAVLTEVETRLRAAGGAFHDFRFRGRAVARNEENKAVRVWATFQDITERKSAERELERWAARALEVAKIETLGVLAGGVAHDFNNKLAAMVVQTEFAMFELEETESKARPLLEDCRRIALEASRLCDQLLAYAGKSELKRKKVDLNQFILQAEPNLQKIPGTTKITFDLNPEPVLVRVDQAQLLRVLVSLVANAKEASEGIELDIVVATWIDEASNTCGFSITDFGPGIAPEHLSKIFDPFYTTKFTGRGLGLATSLGIVRAHGGTIEVESKPNRGTLFEVALPALARADRPVLVVEDEAGLRQKYRQALEDRGLSVIEAATGEEALERIDEFQDSLSLIILDLVIPGPQGAQVLGLIRETYQSLPVIVASGYQAEAFPELPPCQAYLLKPFDRKQLVQAVDEVCKAS